MPLLTRDLLLSGIAGVVWPFEPLLNAPALAPGADVLDVGAGDGRLLSLLREQGHRGRVVGIDPSPGVGVMTETAGVLPFPGASFDAVLLVRVLAHLSDPGGALTEARRVLRPGGRLVVAAHEPDHLRETWRSLGRPEQRGMPSIAPSLDFSLPITVTADDARTLTDTYGWRERTRGFPVQDRPHLTLGVGAG